eukprot:gnl/TRDRNA2_/TRDRNA2_42276_c0_seq1.p1 gnl/TRDRNA2_/TRDRNA2_42276_c0~~gnl/TRDRNA2_/TRDRNA2_42276_c0_seq1.p1  ORF type:complete len:253 (+),score=40.57 gnl/TRDRNA2_/TRDRNA2_42276_c0_seq1:26-760(+)
MASSASSAPGGASGGSGTVPGPLDEDSLAPADLKVIICGDSAVGKSKLVERFLLNDYCPRTLSTYALTLFRHNVDEEGTRWSIDFWDTAGQEQFDTLHASYYFQANACILAFDVTREVTYKNLKKWYKEVQTHCPDIPVICVANKIDESPEMAKKRFNFPVTHRLPFYFVSASDGTNVVRVFKEAIRLAIKNKNEPPDEVMAEIWNLLRDDDTKGRDGACGSYDDGLTPSVSPEPTEPREPRLP